MRRFPSGHVLLGSDEWAAFERLRQRAEDVTREAERSKVPTAVSNAIIALAGALDQVERIISDY